MNFNERQIIQQAERHLDGWTREDGCMYLDTNMSELERHNMNSWGWKWDNGLWIIDLD